MARICRKVRQSLFTKLAIVMILGAVGINVIAYVLYTHQVRGEDRTLNRSLIQYAHTLVDAVGTPPVEERARALAGDRMMRITFEGDKSWTVGETERAFPEEYLTLLASEGDVEIWNVHGNYRLTVRLDRGRTLVFDLLPSEEERAALRTYGLISLGGSCLVMLIVYLVLRYLLRPIGNLTDAAAAVRDGELSMRVAEQGRGELRELAETFNQMTSRLENLVIGQRDLLLGVSHELRTPLTRLKLRLEMLDSSADTSALRTDIRQMETMVTSLLEAAKMQHRADAVSLRSTDLIRLVEDAANGYAECAPGLAVTLPEVPVMADVDPEKMTMAVNTLLDNAIKYSDPSGRPVELGLLETKDGRCISVRDHGAGIPAESVERLFEPFYRVDDSRARETGGYGLGLHLCQAIVKAHGGRIEVESEPGAGTLFRIVIAQKS